MTLFSWFRLLRLPWLLIVEITVSCAWRFSSFFLLAFQLGTLPLGNFFKLSSAGNFKNQKRGRPFLHLFFLAFHLGYSCLLQERRRVLVHETYRRAMKRNKSKPKPRRTKKELSEDESASSFVNVIRVLTSEDDRKGMGTTTMQPAKQCY